MIGSVSWQAVLIIGRGFQESVVESAASESVPADPSGEAKTASTKKVVRVRQRAVRKPVSGGEQVSTESVSSQHSPSSVSQEAKAKTSRERGKSTERATSHPVQHGHSLARETSEVLAGAVPKVSTVSRKTQRSSTTEQAEQCSLQLGVNKHFFHIFPPSIC